MSQSTTVNRRIVLNARPVGAPKAEDFRIDSGPVPQPDPGQVLLRTLYLSLDPYMRGRMSDAPSYAPPLAIGDLMVGGTVSRVEVSRHRDFKVGDLVLGYTGWQDYALSDGQGLTAIPSAQPYPSRALGVLGMPGFTAYMGLLDIGRPVAGETVVVAAASGAVGSVVGQIAKIKGCTVVGIAGGEDKCRYVVVSFRQACMNSERWSGSVGAPRPWRLGGLTLSLSGGRFRAGGTVGPLAARSPAPQRSNAGGRDVGTAVWGGGPNGRHWGGAGISPARVRRRGAQAPWCNSRASRPAGRVPPRPDGAAGRPGNQTALPGGVPQYGSGS